MRPREQEEREPHVASSRLKQVSTHSGRLCLESGSSQSEHLSIPPPPPAPGEGQRVTGPWEAPKHGQHSILMASHYSGLSFSSIKKVGTWGWRNGSLARSTSREPGLGPQHPLGSSPLPVTAGSHQFSLT